MSCDNSNIRQNYIVVGGGESDIVSACTAFYVTNIEACDPTSGITINSNIFIDGETTVNDNLILNRTKMTELEYEKIKRKEFWCFGDKALELGFIDELV